MKEQKQEFLGFLDIFPKYEKQEKDKEQIKLEKGPILAETNINITQRRREIVPQIFGFSINQIITESNLALFKIRERSWQLSDGKNCTMLKANMLVFTQPDHMK